MYSQDIDFSEIAPYDDSVFHQKMENLVKEPGFMHALKYAMPEKDIPHLIEDLLKITNKHDFQHENIFPSLEIHVK